jgi:hypothetical protein
VKLHAAGNQYPHTPGLTQREQRTSGNNSNDPSLPRLSATAMADSVPGSQIRELPGGRSATPVARQDLIGLSAPGAAPGGRMARAVVARGPIGVSSRHVEARRNLQKIAATFPFIQKEASSYAKKRMEDIGLSGFDPDKTMLVRFSRPSDYRLGSTIKEVGMAIRETVDIEQQWSMTEILSAGLPDQVGAGHMGALKGEFGIYRADDLMDKTRQWATGTAAMMREHQRQDPDWARGATPVASLVDSTALYEKIAAIATGQDSFAESYGNTIKTFWKDKKVAYASSQKQLAIDRAFDANQKKQLGQQDLTIARAGLSGRDASRYIMSAVDIGGYRALDAFRIADHKSGRSVLYMPGLPIPWKGFDSVESARLWISTQVATPVAARKFSRKNFSQVDQARDGQGNSVVKVLNSLSKNWGGGLPMLLQDDAVLGNKPFSDLTRLRMNADFLLARSGLSKGAGALEELQRKQQNQWSRRSNSAAVPALATQAVQADVKPEANAHAVVATAVAPVPGIVEDISEIERQYPEFGKVASRYAANYLNKYAPGIDPDRTWMFRFDYPPSPVNGLLDKLGGVFPFVGSAREAFLEKVLTEKRSLTDVFIRNFNGKDSARSIEREHSVFGAYTDADLGRKNVRLSASTQERPDELILSPVAGRAGSSKEIVHSRLDVLRFYKDMQRPPAQGGNDLAQVYLDKVKAFWKGNGERYARVQRDQAEWLLGEASRLGSIDARDSAFIRKGFSGKTGQGATTYPLVIDSRQSTNALRIIDDSSSRVALYLPGEKQPFQVFDSTRLAEDWIRQKSYDKQWVGEFAKRHFSSMDATSELNAGSVQDFLARDLHQSSALPGGGVSYAHALSIAGKISGDPFNYLSSAGRARDIADAIELSTSNDDRKNASRILLAKGIPFIGNLTALALGKGPVKDQAGVDLVSEVAQSAAMFTPVGEAADASEAVGTVASTDLVKNNPVSTAPDSFARAAFDANVSLDGAVPNANGVYTINGKQYISLEGQAARIQGLADDNQRAIVVDESGATLSGVHVLREPGRGEWKIGALKGGNPERSRGPSSILPLPSLAAKPMLTPAEVYGGAYNATELAGLLGASEHAENKVVLAAIINEVRTKQKRLEQDAEQFFKRVGAAHRPGLAPPTTKANSRKILSSVFKKYDGIYIGETHREVASKKFMLANMGEFKRQGVKTIYAEVAVDLIGPDLVQFNRTGVISPALNYYFDHLVTQTGDPRYEFRNVALAAHSKGIAIKPMDSFTADGLKTGDGYSRVQTMNYYAYQAIRSDQRKLPGKWVAWGGAAHSNNSNAAGIPALGRLLNVPSMRVENGMGPGVRNAFLKDPGKSVKGTHGAPVATVTNDWLWLQS